MATRDPWGSLEGLENLLRFLEPIDRAVATFAPLQRVLDSLAIPAVRQFGQARRRDAIARDEASSPPPGPSYIELLVHDRTPEAWRPKLALELAKRWRRNLGIARGAASAQSAKPRWAPRCTRRDLAARVRVHLAVAEQARTPGPVWLAGRRVRGVKRAADLPPDQLTLWFIKEVAARLRHNDRRSRAAGVPLDTTISTTGRGRQRLTPAVRGRRAKKRRQKASPVRR
jgi:hypothetical protein